MRALLIAVFSGISGVCAGCSADDSSARLDSVCDVHQPRCQRAIFAAAAQLRGQPEAPMPAVRTLTLPEFSELLGARAVHNDETALWDGVLPILGLLPEGSSISEEFSELQLSGVAAFYDPATDLVNVIERNPGDPAESVFLLAHEFVHALQDAEVDIEAFESAWASSLDSLVAIRALLEGEATVLGYATLDQALAGSGRRIDWSRAPAGLRASFFENLRTARAPLLAAAVIAPYALGTEQLAPLWRERGQSALAALYATPRLSVLDWTEDTHVSSPTRLEALDCLPTQGPPGSAAVATDSMGPLGVLAVLLRGGATVESAWSSALGVRGDQLVAFEEEAPADSRAIAWRVRFADPALALGFASASASTLAPGAALTTHGREVLYYGTTRRERLAEWTAPDHCGTDAELPRHPEPRSGYPQNDAPL